MFSRVSSCDAADQLYASNADDRAHPHVVNGAYMSARVAGGILNCVAKQYSAGVNTLTEQYDRAYITYTRRKTGPAPSEC